MADAKMLLGAFKRDGLPEVPLINMIAEANPTSLTNPVILRARPGLTDFATVGTAPIRALYQRQGLFGDAAIVVASDAVYRLTAGAAATMLTGTVAGGGRVDIAAALASDGDSIARIATGSALYLVDYSALTVTQETFPDSGNVGASSVDFLGGYWLAVEAASDNLFYLNPAGTVWNAIQFAAAEYAPDKLVAVRVFGEIAALLGESSFEGWRLTGVAASPIEPAGGLKFDIGCRARDAAVNCDGTLIWVDQNCSVRLTDGGFPTIISEPGLDEKIRRALAADLRASFYVKDGHPMYVLRIGDDATWAYDLGAKVWTRMDSNGVDYWRAHLFANIGDTVLAADSVTALISVLDPDSRKDGTATFTAVFCARIEADATDFILSNVVLDARLGDAPLTGQGSDPMIGLEVSRDGGYEYGPLSFRSLGVSGARTVSPRWNALGRFRAPFGAMLKFQLSDPVARVAMAVRYNV